jgi:uncharacterized protein (TIGR02246 family)
VVHPDEEAVRRAYDAMNRRDVDGFVAVFADDAVWHGSGMEIRGNQAIGELVGKLMEASGDTLHIELHDVLVSENHVVALQVTTAERKGRRLADRVVYIFHMENGKIAEAWFNGDPRIQDEFWSS